MVISNLNVENKRVSTLNGSNGIIQTITVDGQEYNFADESDEVVSTVPTDIILEDAVPEPLVKLSVNGNSEQKTYEGYNLADIYGFSAYAITPDPTVSRSLSNNYGTNLSSIDPVDVLEVTQTQYPYTDNIIDYRNGYFCIGFYNNFVKGDYINVSFDCEILENPLNATSISLGPNGIISTAVFEIPPVGVKQRITGRNISYNVHTEYPNRQYIEIRNCGCSMKISNIQIEKKTEWTGTANPYEPYVGGIPSPNPEYPQAINSTSDSEIEIGIHSRNLMDAGNPTRIRGLFAYSDNTLTYGEAENVVDQWPRIGYDLTEVDLFDTYLTINFNLKEINNLEYTTVRFTYISNGVETDIGVKIMTTPGLYSLTTTAKVPKYNDGDIVYISFSTARDLQECSVVISDIMLQRGSSTFEYQPYFRDTVTIPVDSGIVLRGIGDVSDEIIVDNISGTVKNIQNIGECIFSPYSPTWVINDSINLWNKQIGYQRWTSNIYLTDVHPLMCEYLKSGIYNLDYSRNNNNFVSGIRSTIVIKTNGVETLEEFQAWWDATNPIVWGVLKEPIETDITNTTVGQQLLQLSTERGLNTMHVIAEVEPSEVKAKYWKQIR